MLLEPFLLMPVGTCVSHKVMLIMDMEVPVFVQPVQHKRRRDSKNVWMAREDDTDECAKAHFPEETSAGVLDVLLCYRSSGRSNLLCCMLPVYGETS
ncbi:uncharacterized protein LOC122577387 isoform X5 [Bombus pyrosoma]|uniref:uncharacterized protein LOC122577387 isoform X5 n=1 Tax=Bombus pyrosoma TaxID=396416 RepID=UPI001CB8D542|nr:uncharacterized protein LOC122577387 isoform X5 [Bombus pyrosoma]